MNEPLTGLGVDRIELMRTFVRIVEAGSLSAAAEQLGTTQPTVSRRLQSLERSLGMRLLRRSTHAMQLTDDGERCYLHAQALVARWSEMSADLSGAREAPQGVLRVVVPHAFGQQQLVRPLAEYLRRYPEVQVEWLLQDRTPDFVADNIDCAIRVGTVEDPSVVAVLFAEVPRIAVAAPSCAGSADALGSVDALAAMPWLALRAFYRDELVLSNRMSGEQRRVRFRPRMVTDSLYALRSAALLGLGAAVVSAWVVQDDLVQGSLLHLAPEWQAASLPVYLVYPPGRYQPARLTRFLALMRESIPSVAGTVAPRPRRGAAGAPGG